MLSRVPFPRKEYLRYGVGTSVTKPLGCERPGRGRLKAGPHYYLIETTSGFGKGPRISARHHVSNCPTAPLDDARRNTASSVRYELRYKIKRHITEHQGVKIDTRSLLWTRPRSIRLLEKGEIQMREAMQRAGSPPSSFLCRMLRSFDSVSMQILDATVRRRRADS